MSFTCLGTSHFYDAAAAVRYYADYGLTKEDVQRKLNAGEIHIGKPVNEDPNATVVLHIPEFRYFLEVTNETN